MESLPERVRKDFNSLFGIPYRTVYDYAAAVLFQLPFRDSRKKREEVEAKYLDFNSLFGILSEVGNR